MYLSGLAMREDIFASLHEGHYGKKCLFIDYSYIGKLGWKFDTNLRHFKLEFLKYNTNSYRKKKLVGVLAWH